MLARFISGIASGIYTFIVPLYSIHYLVNEFVPLEKTGSFGTLHQIAITFGNFVGVITNVYYKGNRGAILLALPGLVAAIHMAILRRFLNYESPSFLWITNRKSEALLLLDKLYCLNKSSFGEVILS